MNRAGRERQCRGAEPRKAGTLVPDYSVLVTSRFTIFVAEMVAGPR